MIFMNAGDKFYDSEVLKRIADGIEETSGICIMEDAIIKY